MTGTRNSWGLGISVVSVLTIAAVMLLSYYVMPSANPAVTLWVLPVLIGLAGASVLTVGHFSYPRVQNLKIYLAGYSTGLVSLGYLVLVHLIPGADSAFILILFGFAGFNAVIIAVAPGFVKFRTTKIVTWSVVGAELCALLAFRFLISLPAFASGASAADGVQAVAPLVGGLHLAAIPAFSGLHIAAMALTAITCVLAVLLVPAQFHLRGVVIGYALLVYGCWFAVFIWPHHLSAVPMTFVLVPAFLTVGGAVHWLARMEHRASYDPLLQIYNRDYCKLVLAEQTVVSTRPPFTIAMIDIDHFKAVNDTYGHQAGDEVLFAVAQTIQKLVIPEGVVCRYGGEEMVVFFSRATGRDVVPRMQLVRRQIEGTKLVHRGRTIRITVSIGISYRYRSEQKLVDVVRAADKALYMCKNHGRNQIRMVRIKDSGLRNGKTKEYARGDGGEV